MVTVPAIWALSITCVRVSAQGGCVFRGDTCLCRTCPSACTDVLFCAAGVVVATVAAAFLHSCMAPVSWGSFQF